MQEVGRITHAYFAGQLASIRELLRSTTCGRQGVPPENMMLNLWRYIRRAVARELYATGFLRDGAPGAGVITVFHESSVRVLDELLH